MKTRHHKMLLISIVLTIASLLNGQGRPSEIVAKTRKAAQTPQPKKRAVQSASLNRIETATVIVAASTERSKLKTFGTGFIVEHAKRVYVVTCKHVVLEASSPNFFAIYRPLKTRSLPDGYAPMRLGKPVYHPNDVISGTYDIAVLEIVDTGKKTLASLGISPLELAAREHAPYAEGVRLAAAGYPVEYADRELAVGKLEPLRPLHMEGIVTNVPLEIFAQRGFGAALRESYFAQTVERPFGKGSSGGPVYIDDDEDVVVGILLGFADVTISQDGQNTNITGFVFATSIRIVETIKSSLPRKPSQHGLRRQ